MKTWTMWRVCCRSVLTLLLGACLAGLVPQAAKAAVLSWSPTYVDFGIVPIGSTAYQTLTLTNNDAAEPIRVSNIVFTFNQAGAFDWSTAVLLPADIEAGASMEIELSFTPVDFSFAMADMWIYNNSANASPSFYIGLLGEGSLSDPCEPLTNCGGACFDVDTDIANCGTCGNVCPTPANGTPTCTVGVCGFVCDEGYEPDNGSCSPIVSQTPLEMLQALIAFAEDARENGTLIGLGPGASAEHRMDAFFSMLEQAEEDMVAEKFDDVCGGLREAQVRTDGGYPFVLPPDFVIGDAAYIINDRLLNLMEVIDEMSLSVYCVPKEPKTRPAAN